MTLRELCEELNISRRAIQGYEKFGLVHATGHTKHGYLLYDPEVQDQIRRIRLLQEVGFSLREIKELWSLPIPEQRELLIAKQKAFQEKRDRMAKVLECLEDMISNL